MTRLRHIIERIKVGMAGYQNIPEPEFEAFIVSSDFKRFYFASIKDAIRKARQHSKEHPNFSVCLQLKQRKWSDRHQCMITHEDALRWYQSGKVIYRNN